MYCKDIPPSGVEECLREHLGSIKSQRCRVVSHVKFFTGVERSCVVNYRNKF